MILWLLGIGGIGGIVVWTVLKWLSSNSEVRKTLFAWVLPALHRRFTFFRQRYNQALVVRLSQLDNRGLRGAESRDVAPHYVPLRLAHRDPADTRNLILDEPDLVGTFSIWDILRSRWSAHRCLAIISPSGSGKTTLLQHVGIVLASPLGESTKGAGLRRIPIFIRLHEYAATIRKDLPTLSELLSRIEEPYRPPRGWFEVQLKAGRCVIMLDGVDEIADIPERATIITWLEKQMALYLCQFIVTGRPEGFDRRQITATALTICPFGPSEISAFIENWYRPGITTKLFGRTTESAKHRDIVERLRTPVLASFAVNPLLLTMMLIVHDSGRTLPQKRTELCNEICDVLLHHRQKAKGIEDDIALNDKRSALELLAFEMTFKRLPSWDRFFAERAVRSDRYDSARLVSAAAKSGILFEVGSRVTFSHRSFREFLTAAYVAHNEVEATLTEDLSDRSLDEVRRFYCGLTSSKEIIKRCLDKVVGPVSASDLLPLIYDCAVEGEADDGVWWQLRSRLEAGARSHFWEDTARVLLLLRIKGLLLGGAIARDDTFITNLEFHLYRQQAPQSMTVWRFVMGEELAAAKGVTYSEAQNFCTWLGRRGNQRFRLPNQQEADNGTSNCSVVQTLKFIIEAETGCWIQGRTLRASAGAIAKVQSSLQVNVSSYLYLDDTKGDVIQTICQLAIKLKPRMDVIQRSVKWLDPDRAINSLREHSPPEEKDPLNVTMQNIDEEWKRELAYGKTAGWEYARDLERALQTAFDLEVAAEEVRRLTKPWDSTPSQGLVLVRLFRRTLRQFEAMKAPQERARARVTFVICAFVSDTILKMRSFARSRYVMGPKYSSGAYELLRDNCLEAFWNLVLIEQRVRSAELNYEGFKIVSELVDFERGSDE